MLSDAQIKLMADMFLGAGQVFLASLVIPYFIADFSTLHFFAGTILVISAWSSALLLTKSLSPL